ncbi:MAG: hypothetical protein Q8R39_02890 [bacterium]|nr:hypothetical protein [bacterium]
MNTAKKTAIILLAGVLLVGLAIFLVANKKKPADTVPTVPSSPSAPLAYSDLYPVATSSTLYGGWDKYVNAKHDYTIFHPRQMGPYSGEDESDERQWDTIKLERSDHPNSEWSVRVSLEAWEPAATYTWTNKRVDAVDLKTFAEESKEAMSLGTTPGVDEIPSEIKETTVGPKKAYVFSWHDQATLFIEHNGTKFVIMYSEDPVSGMIAKSMTFGN